MIRSVVSLDASLTGFAICILFGDTHYIYETTSKPTKSLLGRIDRLRKLVDWAKGYVKQYAPELLLIEGYSFNSRGNSSVSLGELGGILRHELIGYADTMVEVPPTVIKKFSSGKGNANKIQVATALTARYGVEFGSDNQSDVFGLAKLGQVVLGYADAETAYQRSSAEVVRDLIRQETQYENTV